MSRPPVYLTYFTAWPVKGGIRFQSDPYALDAPQAHAGLASPPQGT